MLMSAGKMTSPRSGKIIVPKLIPKTPLSICTLARYLAEWNSNKWEINAEPAPQELLELLQLICIILCSLTKILPKIYR
jgi:hypothetical protein